MISFTMFIYFKYFEFGSFFEVFLFNMILNHFSKLFCIFMYMCFDGYIIHLLVRWLFIRFSWSSCLNWKFFFIIINITALDLLMLSFVCVWFSFHVWLRINVTVLNTAGKRMDIIGFGLLIFLAFYKRLFYKFVVEYSHWKFKKVNRCFFQSRYMSTWSQILLY